MKKLVLIVGLCMFTALLAAQMIRKTAMFMKKAEIH